MILKVNNPEGGRLLLDDIYSIKIAMHDGGYFADIITREGKAERVPLLGPSFLMNDDGVTVDRFYPQQ